MQVRLGVLHCKMQMSYRKCLGLYTNVKNTPSSELGVNIEI